MSTVNLYDVLDIDNNSSIEEIKEAYRRLAKKFHPDKPGGDAEMFELIIHAYSVLSNPETKQEYDKLYRLKRETENSHEELKKQVSEFYNVQKESINNRTKPCFDILFKALPVKEIEKEYKKIFNEMDKKRNYNRERENEKLDEETFSRVLSDMMIAREQEDIENTYDKLFEDGRFDLEKFNAAFDKVNKKQLDIIHHNGNPNAWGLNDGLDGKFSSINNYEDIFADDEDETFTTAFTTMKEVEKTGNALNRISKQDIDRLDGVSYVKEHNKIESDFNRTIEEKIKERELETQKIDSMSFDKFNTDPSCGGYGFLHEVTDVKEQKLLDDNDELNKKYQRLLKGRKM